MFLIHQKFYGKYSALSFGTFGTNHPVVQIDYLFGKCALCDRRLSCNLYREEGFFEQ